MEIRPKVFEFEGEVAIIKEVRDISLDNRIVEKAGVCSAEAIKYGPEKTTDRILHRTASSGRAIMERTRLKSLEDAIQKEEGEKSFYLEAASRAKTPVAKTVFEELAKEEDVHRRRVLDIFEELKQDKEFREWVPTAETSVTPAALFQGTPLKGEDCADDICALQTGLDMEDRSVKYYDALAMVAQNKYEKRLYLVLSHEERGHYLRVMDAIEYLTDPVGWLYVHQKSMEDGG